MSNWVNISGQETGAVQEDGTVSVLGQLTASDSHSNASYTWSALNSGTGTYGTLSINSAGKWTYTLNNSAANVQALAAGEQVTDTITVKVVDQWGVSDTQTIVVTVNGTNDAPMISGVATGSVQEDTTLTTTGQLHSTDVDHNATASWSVANGTGTYGSLAVDATGKWTYTVNNAASNVQSLAQGQTVADTFTVKVTDDKGAVTNQTVTINVAGTNDAPVITGTSTGLVKEDTTLTSTGQLTATDVDQGATKAWSIASGTGTYGSLAVDQTGKWTYTLNNSAANVQALKADEQASDTFTVKVTDDKGAVTNQTVTVNITGTNDAPVVSGTSTGSVTEDTTLTTTGQLTSTDVDHNATASWSIVNSAGTYGSLALDQTGKWTYTLNNSASNVQALDDGQHVTDTFTVKVTDDKGAITNKTVTVTINGTADAPVITGVDTGTAKEDVTVTVRRQRLWPRI